MRDSLAMAGLAALGFGLALLVLEVATGSFQVVPMAAGVVVMFLGANLVRLAR